MYSNTDGTGSELPCEEAVAQLEAQMQGRLRGRVYDLRLALRDGGVVLKGRARTYYAKQLAQHTVMSAIALPICANDIEVT